MVADVLCTSHDWSHLSLRDLCVGSHAEDERAQQNGTEASNDSDGDEVDLDRVRSHSNAGTSAAHDPYGVHLCIVDSFLGRIAKQMLSLQNSALSKTRTQAPCSTTW